MQPVRNQVRQLWEMSKAALSRPMPLDEPLGQAGEWLVRDDVAMGTAIRVELWCEDAARGNAAADEVMAKKIASDTANVDPLVSLRHE